MRRFVDTIGFVSADDRASPPTTERIAAIGNAMPAGAHSLSDAQQRAWFGWVAFDAPVAWDGDAFVSGEMRLSPTDLAKGGR